MNDEPDPAVQLAALATAARRMETPCGSGVMVWHVWGDGPALVLLHGGSGSWRHWARNIRHFAQNRCVLAPDLPGLGESAMPPQPYHPDSVARIVIRGISEILGGARYDLAGFSFGALIAGHMEPLDASRVRSLSLIGASSLGLPRTPVELQTVRDKTGLARLEANRTNLVRLMFADPAHIDALALTIQEWNTQHARLNSRQFSRAPYLRDAIARSKAPLSVIWGERDVVAWPYLRQREAMIRGLRPDVAFRVIADAGHWVAYEAADAFNALLDQLLNTGE